MNIGRVREMYGKSGEALYRRIITLLRDLKKREAVTAPVDALKDTVEFELGETIDSDTELVEFMRVFLSPLAKVSLRTRRKVKKVFIEKIGSPEDFKRALRREKPQKYGTGIGVKCIACNKRFDFFTSHEGDCEVRYRGSGRVVDSLVLCPDCLRKRELEMDGKIYYKKGACSKPHIPSSLSKIQEVDIDF